MLWPTVAQKMANSIKKERRGKYRLAKTAVAAMAK